MIPKKDLSKTELMIMKCIWGSEAALTATQIQEEVSKQFQTNVDRRCVGSLMYRLEEKGYVEASPTGPVNVTGKHVNLYTALISEADMRAYKTTEFVKWWYNGSAAALVASLQDR